MEGVAVLNQETPKDRILDLSERLFFRFGYQRVTTEEIAREAGVSKRTLYEMFPSKSDIVVQSFERAEREVDAFLRGTAFDNCDTYITNLSTFLHLIVTVHSRYSEPMMDDLKVAEEALHARITAFQRQYVSERLRDILRQGVEVQCVRNDISLDVMTVIITTAVQFLLHPDTPSAPQSDEKPTPQIVFSTLMDGILVP
ncbi:hypothetical protein BH10BAC6_BH10BAC6_04560 [soil metagenome]